MRIRFMSGYDRLKTFMSILSSQKKMDAGKIAENITPAPINPGNIAPEAANALTPTVIKKQNKGVK